MEPDVFFFDSCRIHTDELQDKETLDEARTLEDSGSKYAANIALHKVQFPGKRVVRVVRRMVSTSRGRGISWVPLS